MKIPSSASSSTAPETVPPPPLPSPSPSPSPQPTMVATGVERRHHGSSADFLRRFGGAQAVAPTVVPTHAHQTSSLGSLAQSLCVAMQSRHPQQQLAELLHAGWFDAPAPADAEVTVRHAWPFKAGECMVSAASMNCRATDGDLQQLYLQLDGEPLDIALMEQQFGKMHAAPAYQDGGAGEVQFSSEQPWGRLSVVADASSTVARALLLEPRANEDGSNR